ncbi:arsenite methyltransferase [Tepidiforma sp.]|uniref:arsenite methyltransferase n=1 Tax=Tepidiforma sp. TaxID=2682230 RepID=UPI002ADD621B|nr:arsenite methyltransferase [Tepidiforma sp.]
MPESYAVQPARRYASPTELRKAARACRTCRSVVPGSAVLAPPPAARPILFVGEAPGRLGAARTGRPFDGDVAGSRFRRLLAASGLPESAIALTNAVLCLPLDERGRNRRPRPSEIRSCTHLLAATIDLVDPLVVVALGAVALEALAALEPHGLALRTHVARPCRWRGRWLLPLYHPAARSAIHRPLQHQLADWRRLGALVRPLLHERASEIFVDRPISKNYDGMSNAQEVPMPAPSPDEIREQVARAYANRVQPVLQRAEATETLPVVESDRCCAPAPVEQPATNCCGDAPASDDVIVSRIAELYRATDIADLPATVTDVAFGCGNPTAISALQPGQVVLDLGSGGGIDCFLAAKMVGPAGRVYGVDMTPEMVRLARKNAEKVGAANVEFRLGEIEHIPMPDESVDVVISNCVINLSPDKPQVFREAFRVLRPGGRLQISDIVWTKPVPPDIRGDMEKWAGCIAGALLESEYLDHIRAAGFVDVTSTATEYPGGRGLASAAVTARKPAPGETTCGCTDC